MKIMTLASNAFLTRASMAICAFLEQAVACRLDIIRLARALWAMLFAGSMPAELVTRTIEQITTAQCQDGGWTEPEETAWAIGSIGCVERNDDLRVHTARQWLSRTRKPTGGWGRHSRDKARITITALVAALVPEAIRTEDLSWLNGEWEKDFYGHVRLSYKAGFFLLSCNRENDLSRQTIAYLFQDQNEDGGFAPWKGHPIGSDPWSTGVVLWGLSRWAHHSETHEVMLKALAWLERSQLPSGYWPYHYLDDGTSLALIGAVAAMKALAANK